MKRVAFAALLGLAAVAAHAEVWGYLDDKGTAHFASEKLDDRYELFFRSGQSFDTKQATPRAVAVPTAATKLIAFFEVSPTYKQVLHHLRAASEATGLDFELLKAVIATESGFDASAVSSRGAVGLMQVMPATAQQLGLTADAKRPLEKRLADPGTNIRIGARYLKTLLDQFPGRIELALAAYNAGTGAVQRAGNQIPKFPETQNYVHTVMQLYEMLKPPAAVRMGEAIARVQAQFPAARSNTPTSTPTQQAVAGLAPDAATDLQ